MPNLSICPECRVIHGGAPDTCSACGTSLAWLRDAPELGEAMRSEELFTGDDRGADVLLQLRSATPQGTHTEQSRLDARCTATFHPLFDRPLTVRLDPGALEAELEFDQQHQTVAIPSTIDAFGMRLELALLAVSRGDALAPGSLSKRLPHDLRFQSGTTRIGRAAGKAEAILPDPSVAPLHALFHREGETSHCWLIDASGGAGTWVNGRAIASIRLFPGDLIRIGPFAFVFDDGDCAFISVNEITGSRLDLERVSIPGRLAAIGNLTIEPGEFVAIAGPSGCGKTTLMQAIAGLPDLDWTGRISLRRGDGPAFDNRVDAPDFRRQLGYVSQDPFIHSQLTIDQALGCTREMQFGAIDKHEIHAWLRQLGLPERERVRLSVHGAPIEKSISELSGGQRQRVRTAAQLIREPSLLLLDEPGSGLDADVERQLMKMLAALARRGCTVVLILHNLDMVRYCDRVLWIEKRETDAQGRLAGEFAPDEFLEWYRRGRPESRGAAADTAPPPAPATSATPAKRRYVHSAKWLQQFFAILKRERDLLLKSSWSRFVVPVGLLPLLFALSITLGVSGQNRDLLGFFAVLASIWMGASLTLLSIADEREVYDHEHFLYLRSSPYVFAKAKMASWLSLGQSILFLLLLTIFGRLFGRPKMLLSDWWGLDLLFCFALVGMTATTLGLLISAVAGRKRELAGFLLPLAMIFQIVFSATVSLDQSSTLKNVRQQFSLFPSEPGASRDAAGSSAVVASYLTLSRWGDQMLRSFAYYDIPKDQSALATWAFWGSAGWLLFDMLVLLGGTLLVLRAQESGRLARWKRLFARG